MQKLLATLLRWWFRFAEILGNIQMTILLSLIYWTMMALIAVPFRLLADPLALRHPSRARWIPRSSASQTLDDMRRQG